jgi:hypothetical protein
MEENKETENINFETGTPDQNNQNLKINNPQIEQRNMTSYSFVRNNEDSDRVSLPSTPPIGHERPSGQNYIQTPSQVNQVSQAQYGQMPPQMPMGYGNQSQGYPNMMYAPPVKTTSPIIGVRPPGDLRIAFQDNIPLYNDTSNGGTPCSQVDPSPTAENMIPGFLKDEIGNKTYILPNKISDDKTQGKLRFQNVNYF